MVSYFDILCMRSATKTRKKVLKCIHLNEFRRKPSHIETLESHQATLIAFCKTAKINSQTVSTSGK